MTDPEWLFGDWTAFLGGPVKYPDLDAQAQPSDDAAPPLEPVPESPTLRRLRAERRRVNDPPA
ncbi:hypothetical protein ACIRVF_11975 [Kitasatospora sp. NPDC101157]|uniref:hypothetical protein n=1 Tax=Kitasatospora sp. NPDC101157 TaxID=3364098 RepID=UPI0038109794